jgi:hypothetical protein
VPPPTFKPPFGPLTLSIDAAVELVEYVLPGWSWDVSQSTGVKGEAVLWHSDMNRSGRSMFRVDGNSPSLAILAAMLRVKIDEETAAAGPRL